MIRRSYKVRLYPNRTQERRLERALDLHRELYNAALQERRDAYRQAGVSVRYTTQALQLKEIRAEREDLSGLNFTGLQQTLRRVEITFGAFFNRVKRGETPGYPRFKGRHRFNALNYIHRDGAKVVPLARGGARLYLQDAGGEIRLRGWRDLPEDAIVKQIGVRRQAGRWYAIITWEAEAVEPSPGNRPSVGVDLGLSSLAVLSDGATVGNPRHYRRAEKRLAEAQQRLSRCKQGSNRRKKRVQQAARAHERVRNARLDHHHKLSRRLVEAYGLIGVEDLEVKRMIESGRYAKSITDAGWGLLAQLLEYKAESAGTRVERVDPRFTTQSCSGCGCIAREKLTITDRLFSCSACGLELDRDVNAARNVLARALQQVDQEARTGPAAPSREVEPVAA